VRICSLNAQLLEAHNRIEELQRKLQQSQQALLVRLARDSLGDSFKPHEDHSQDRELLSPPLVVRETMEHDSFAGFAKAVPSSTGKMSCNVNVPELIRCAERGEAKSVEVLLGTGEDPNCTDDMGLTALHGAAKKGHHDVVLLLLHHRANANISAWRGEAPLHYACKYGHRSIVELLLQNGAQPDIKSHDNRTPSAYAADKRHRCIKDILEEAVRAKKLSQC
jgi:hypothetical protein